MQSIFHPSDNKELIDRIHKLSPITLSQWGKMTVSQMLKHCQQPINVSNGTLILKANWMSFLFGKMAKKKLSGPKPFTRDLPTLKEFVITGEPDFELSKKELIALIEVFAADGHNAIKNKKHPLFGEMTMEEWDFLQWKHLDHHLKQFGV